MALKSRVRNRLSNGQADKKGFILEKPELRHFKTQGKFETALKLQADSMVSMDGDYLKQIDIEGKVDKTDWHLSHAAFSDLCHWTKTPVSFVKKLAKIDEALALEVVETMIRQVFHSGREKQLIIDSRNWRVEGIVGKDSYSPISNVDVLHYALTAVTELDLTNGWLAGPTMRMTATSPLSKAEPVKGDIVHFGMAVENSIHGDCSCRVMDYSERLVCTNGMTARDSRHMRRVMHRGDVEFNVQEAVLQSAGRAEEMAPLMDKASGLFLDVSGIRAVRSFIKDTKNGGSPALDIKVTKAAMAEAVGEGRPEEEVTLWNFANGVTERAHEAKSIDRRVELESLGYRTLVRFGTTLAQN